MRFREANFARVHTLEILIFKHFPILPPNLGALTVRYANGAARCNFALLETSGNVQTLFGCGKERVFLESIGYRQEMLLTAQNSIQKKKGVSGLKCQ